MRTVTVKKDGSDENGRADRHGYAVLSAETNHTRRIHQPILRGSGSEVCQSATQSTIDGAATA